MFKLDILTNDYKWMPYYQSKEIELISDKLIYLTQTDPDRKVRFLYHDRVLEFLSATEKQCEYFIKTYIDSDSKRLEYADKLYKKYYKNLKPKEEKSVVKVKFKNKTKKVKRK